MQNKTTQDDNEIRSLRLQESWFAVFAVSHLVKDFRDLFSSQGGFPDSWCLFGWREESRELENRHNWTADFMSRRKWVFFQLWCHNLVESTDFVVLGRASIPPLLLLRLGRQKCYKKQHWNLIFSIRMDINWPNVYGNEFGDSCRSSGIQRHRQRIDWAEGVQSNWQKSYIDEGGDLRLT